MILKQSTAYTRMFFLALTSDHFSPSTGKTVTVKLSKAGASGVTAGGTVSEVDSANLPGVYKIALTTTDTNTLGDLAFACTATSSDQTTFVDEVMTDNFADLSMNGNGEPLISSNIKQNTALSGFMFVMTLTADGSPATGKTVTAQRSLAGAGFASCANAVSELSNGIYKINLAAADLNAASVMLRFTATDCNDRVIHLITQP